MNEENEIVEGEDIDIMEILQKLWNEKMFIVKSAIYAAIVGVVIAFSIPKEYNTSSTLAPEQNSGGGISGSLGAFSSMLGISMGNKAGGDALNVGLYPDIVSSTPFITELFNVEVKVGKDKRTTTLYDYMNNDVRSPWWNVILSAPIKAIGWSVSLFKDKEEDMDSADGKLDPSRLTLEQEEVVQALRKAVMVSVDKKTGITTINVTSQDPEVTYTLAKVVLDNLQTYITDYRTNKARHDLEFVKKLYDESKAQYAKAQMDYANFVDRNKNIVRLAYRSEEQALQNEVSLAYNIYNSLSNQLQTAKAKVQEESPVFTVLEPSTLPTTATKPNKPLTLIAFVFLGIIASSAWALKGRELIGQLKNKNKENANI